MNEHNAKTNWNIHVKYWGTSGSISSPLKPSEVTEKIIDSICTLAKSGHLKDIDHVNLESSVAKMVHDYLPFSLKSTFGGNTSCVEINTEDCMIVIDCGTGVINFGINLESKWANLPIEKRKGLILFSHMHYDHLFGLPMCQSFYDTNNSFDLYGCEKVAGNLIDFFHQNSDMVNSLYPPILSNIKAIKKIIPFEENSPLVIGSTKISHFQLNHPGGANAYKIECKGKSYVYASDHEQLTETDTGLANFCKDADAIYLDGQFLLSEYLGQSGIGSGFPTKRIGWGHSPMEWCLLTALAANTKELHMGHRDPRRSDIETENVLAYLKGHAVELSKSNQQNCPEILFPHEEMDCFI
ncbi:MAG: MBL fold metallo-hydrolase [Planctomycetota bacterium]